MSIDLLFLVALPLLIFLFLLPRITKNGGKLPPPPGPPGLPFIGNLHQLDNSNLHECLWQLSKKYGPVMSLCLGSVPTVVISSARLAKEVLKTQDLKFCSRPALIGPTTLSYNGCDVATAPYSDYWREMKKVCTLHLFSVNRLQYFRPIHEDEVMRTIKGIKQLSLSSELVNLSETFNSLTSTIIIRAAFGKRFEVEGIQRSRFSTLFHELHPVTSSFYFSNFWPSMGWIDRLAGLCARLDKTFKGFDAFYQELIDEHLDPSRPKTMREDFVDILLQLKNDKMLNSFDLTMDHIKGVLVNIFLGGTETTATTLVWATTALMKEPRVMNKVQEEVRNVVGKKGFVDADDLPKLPYLKAVVKEAMRLYPVLPLLLPRETRDKSILDGYELQQKTLVFVNAWAIGRDPEAWEKPEEFWPERFEGSSIDFKGHDFGLIPFGAGRRGCPAVSMGAMTVELALSNLLYSFNWKLPAGMRKEDIDFESYTGTAMIKKNDLCLLAEIYEHAKMDGQVTN